MVIHQFHSAGYYRASIMHRGHAVTNLDFEVNEKSEVMQLDIDLSEAVQRAKARLESCGCHRETLTERVVSPKGYVLFHASSGAGHSVIVSNGEEKEVFASTRLGKGDLFAVSLLEPTVYLMKNTIGSASGEIVVSLTPEETKRIKTLETLYIDVSQEKFDPERIQLSSTQGLVFRINDSAARILIEKRQALQQDRSKPIIRWQKLQTGQARKE